MVGDVEEAQKLDPTWMDFVACVPDEPRNVDRSYELVSEDPGKFVLGSNHSFEEWIKRKRFKVTDAP